MNASILFLDLTVSFTKGIMLDPFALLGTDIFLSNIVEDITYYSSNQQYSYAFLIDMEGRVLVHPSILRPSAVSHQLSFVDLKLIETIPDVELLRTRVLMEVNGNHITKNIQNETVSNTF